MFWRPLATMPERLSVVNPVATIGDEVAPWSVHCRRIDWSWVRTASR